jgi:hypothetical protein
LAALNDIAMMVTSSLNLLEVLRSIQEHVLATLREPYPPVFALYDEENQLFRVTVTHVRKKVLDELNKLLGMNLDDLVFSAKDTKSTAVREAIIAGKPYLTADGSDLLGSKIAKMLVAGAQRAFGVKCFVIVPLKAKDK